MPPPKDPPNDPPKDRPKLPPGRQLVAALDTAVPLALFPVRLATRFHRPSADKPPTELWVRIFPDLLHADGHLPELSSDEIVIGHAYWEQLWRAGGSEVARLDAHRWIVAQLGGPRASWVAARTAPANPEDVPRKPVSADQPLRPRPRFSKLQPRAVAPPTLARLLPDRWCVVMRRSVEYIERVWSQPVRRDLAMAPNLADIPADGGIRQLLQVEDLWWMVDFDEAVAAGMAVKLPWNASIRPRHVTELIAFGVRDKDPGAVDELRRLLEAHRFTEGLEFVPQGTPTNNTDTVRAGFTDVPDDLAGYLDRQLAAVTVRRPALDRPHVLGMTTAANAASISLGLEAANALDHAEHASLRSGSWARDMNRSLWPATIRYFFSNMLATDGVAPLSAADLAWLGNWFRDWVRAAGLLPALRLGTMPYGMLPVARRPVWGDDIGASRIDRLESVLLDLDHWANSVGYVAHFSHLAGAPPPTPEEEAARLAAVLGAVPHPTAFRLREAKNHHGVIAADWAAQIAEMERLLENTTYLLNGQQYEQDLKVPINEGSVDEQSSALSRLRDVAHNMLPAGSADTDAAIAAVRDHIDGLVRPLTSAHKIRSETRRWSEQFSGAHLPTPDDPPLWYVEYGMDGSAPDGTFPTLRLVPAAQDPARTAAMLRDHAGDARTTTSIHRPNYPGSQPASLLEKLVQQAVETVPPGDAEELALGLDGLADMLDSGDVPEPLVELERLLRETLGSATCRYDAWATSVANQRLASMRAKTPGGIQLGGYGWLVNLCPDDGPGADTQGFIHAPSLDHAVTAAVLRSAWIAHSNDAQDAPFGVDLTSDRVRRAMWLLEGVRNGVDLAELLGARFERRLHDHGLSHAIADVRERVLEATGNGGTPASAIVDGLALAVAYSESTTEDPVRDALESWRKKLPGKQGDALLAQLEDTVADLDATADLLTAQAVHSVTKHNLAEAAATLSVGGAGDAGIPPLRVPSVHRPSRIITHRVVAILGAPDSPASPSLLALADPSLAAWLDSLLPDLDQIFVKAVVAVPGADGAEATWSASIGSTGLSAVEVVASAAVAGDLAASRLGALLSARARLETGAGSSSRVTLTDAGAGSITLDDLAITAGALHSAIGSARPLRGADLVDGPDHVHEVAVAEIDSRRRALAGALQTLASQDPDANVLTERFADLAALDLEGLIAALSAPGRSEPIVKLLSKAAEAAATLNEPFPADYVARDPQAQADYLADRIRGALSLPLPILARHTVSNREDLRAGFAATRRQIGPPVRAIGWLLEVGRVHPGAGRCSEAIDLAESIRPGEIPFQVAQLPHVAGEPWVAVDAPTGSGSRLHILSVTDAASALERGPVSGLLFDAWSEPIPGRAITTGLAVHFDRPGAHAPQAVLLAMPPKDGPWTVEEIETTLIQTLQLAQMRAVGPETLQSWGHTLPAVYLSGDVAVATIGEESAK